MDTFLRDINTLIYFKYILSLSLQGIKITQGSNEDELLLDTPFVKGKVTKYKNNVIEEEVISKDKEEVLFYIHFQMANMKHALDLLKEMIDCIYESYNEPIGKILLCCSGGMTTTLYAHNMQKLAKMEHLNYSIDACGFNLLYEIGEDYDVILLAPEVAYLLAEAKSHLSVKVEAIPTKYFARNDYHHALMYAIKLNEGEK